MTQVTVLTGRDRRRKWDLGDRHRILTMAFAPGAVIADIARQFDIASSMIYKWRRQALATKVSGFAPAVITEDLAALPSVPSVPSPLAPPSATEVLGAITVKFPSGVLIWIATVHTDMRRGMRGLALQVQVQAQEGLGRDPFAGDVFVFRGRSGSLIKAIWHDGVGLSVYAKRLDRGKFIWPQTVNGVVSLTAAQMSCLLEAIDWRNPQHTWRPQSAG